MTKFTRELGLNPTQVMSPKTLFKENGPPIEKYHNLKPHNYITDNIKIVMIERKN